MASIFNTNIRRGRVAIAAAVVVAGFAVAGSVPAQAAASMTAPAARACVPGKIVDFCRAVPPADGFRLDKGTYETFAFPGASLTVPYRSNNRGQVVGAYQDAGGTTHGLLLDKDVARNVDFPGSKETVLFSINNRGRIVGGYLDPDGKARGLLRDAKGNFTTFSTPQASSQTGGLDINDQRQIVGIFR
jgi:hypothetical protein